MSQKEMAHKIEGLCFEAEKIHSLQRAIFEAIYNGNAAYTEYEWAFIVLEDLAVKTRNELKELTNIAFENLRKDSEDIVKGQ